MPSDTFRLLMLVHRRVLFVLCRRYLPLLNEPGLPPAELELRWQSLTAYFNRLGNGLARSADEVSGQTQGGQQAKQRAA